MALEVLAVVLTWGAFKGFGNVAPQAFPYLALSFRDTHTLPGKAFSRRETNTPDIFRATRVSNHADARG